MGKIIDITGKRFGRLVAVKMDHINKHKQHCWSFICDCGNKKIVNKHDVMNGFTKSCGCLVIETSKKYNTKHGLCGTKFYYKFHSMIKRCNDKNNIKYYRYGERGIKVCDIWKNNFEKFRDDMYGEYLKHVDKHGEKDTTLERKNYNGNYSLENCEWATRETQANNTSRNHFLTYNNKTMTISQWIRRIKKDLSIDINSSTIISRLKMGWTVEKVLTTPVYKKKI